MKRITGVGQGGWWRVRAARTSLECGFEGTRVGGSKPSAKKRTGPLFSFPRADNAFDRCNASQLLDPATRISKRSKDLSPLESSLFSPFARNYRFLSSSFRFSFSRVRTYIHVYIYIYWRMDPVTRKGKQEARWKDRRNAR